MSQSPRPDAPTRTETLIEAPPFTPPANFAGLPGYRLQKLLGQGGMGEVYLAHNVRMDRPEVLKAVHKELLTKSGAMDRFRNEIRNAGRLQHPNIVTAYSCLEAGDILVLAMEYVPGQDLAAIVKAGGALPVANACHYARQAALGLQHAFEKGMVHRDIKPHNLMLHRDGTRHTVKILDFGLAKVTSEKPVDGGLTRDGQMLGTPDYVAPEQTRDAARADIRADIYSLGCTLHYLIAGRPPFSGTSLFEILEAHNFKPAAALHQLRPDVPAALSEVVAKMMAKDPAQRYQTPAQVAAALLPFTKPATKVLVSKPAGPPPMPAPAATPPPVGAGTTAPALSGATPSPVQGTSASGAKTLPPPVPKASNSDWRFEDSGNRSAAVVRPPAGRNRSKFPVLLGLSALIILVGGSVGGLYLAGVLFNKASSTAPVVEVAQSPPEPEPRVEPAELIPTPSVTNGKKFGPMVPDPKPNPAPIPPVTPVPAPAPIPKPKVETPVVKNPEPGLDWKEVFDARTLAGWVQGESNGGSWTVENKEIVGTGTDKVTRPAVLLTRLPYRNFVLRFEAFTGDTAERRLLVRSRDTADRLRGYALLLSGTRSGAGALAAYDNDPVRCVPNWQRPTGDVRTATGTWTKWEVSCVGPRIHVKLDGREVADWQLDGDPHSSGGLGFAAAGTVPLRIKNVQVADLPPKFSEACKLAGITERGSQSGSASQPIPYGDAFWRKWQTFGATDWDVTPDGKLTLKGAGGLVTKGTADALTVTLAPAPDSECWLGLKLTPSGATFTGPGVRIAGMVTTASAGQGAIRANEPLLGTGRQYKLGEFFTVEMAVTKILVISGEEGGRRVPHLVGTVYADSTARPKEPNCKVPLDDEKPARVGMILKKGSVTIQVIEGS